jgi:hypothetical protein
MLTALWEGLRDKTQRSLEKVYELNKNYAESGAIIGLGRFWAMLPWPFRDREKALKYLREYHKTEYLYNRPEGLVFLGELLLELGGEEDMAEAKLLLEEAAQSDVKYFRDRAKKLLAENY